MGQKPMYEGYTPQSLQALQNFHNGGKKYVLVAHTRFGDLYYDATSFNGMLQSSLKMLEFNLGCSGICDGYKGKDKEKVVEILNKKDGVDAYFFLMHRSGHYYQYEAIDLEVLS